MPLIKNSLPGVPSEKSLIFNIFPFVKPNPRKGMLMVRSRTVLDCPVHPNLEALFQNCSIELNIRCPLRFRIGSAPLLLRSGKNRCPLCFEPPCPVPSSRRLPRIGDRGPPCARPLPSPPYHPVDAAHARLEAPSG